MSSTGNRSNPNKTRTAGGKQDATHQESRDHNKHNNPGQDGHKPQQHSPAQEKR